MFAVAGQKEEDPAVLFAAVHRVWLKIMTAEYSVMRCARRELLYAARSLG